MRSCNTNIIYASRQVSTVKNVSILYFISNHLYQQAVFLLHFCCGCSVVYLEHIQYKLSRYLGTVNAMRCEAFAQELADLPPISFNFEALTNEQVIKKVRKVLQVC